MLGITLLLLSVLLYNLLDALRLPDPPIFTSAQHYPCICYLPPDSGICPVQKNKHNVTSEAPDEEAELLVRYYFDPVTEQCYPFGAQLCGGNANRFDSLAQCQSFCRKRK